MIPASHSNTIEVELQNIANWASINNLKLNRLKSKELIFHNPKSNIKFSYPSPISDVQRVTELKCLGIILSTNFSFSSHISNVISSCSSNLFALRTLRSRGMSNQLLNRVFQATTLSKLLYASQFWYGFLTMCDRERLENFLKRSQKAGFYINDLTFNEMCLKADVNLFYSLQTNHNHLLRSLLPSMNHHNYETRRNFSNRTYIIQTKRSALNDKNFITRMILKDAIKI